MAEDKVNTGPEEQVPGEGETTVTPPETIEGGPHVQEDGDLVVDFEKINQLMAERRAAAREEVEQGDAASDLPGPEEKPEAADPPLPGDGDNAAPVQEEMCIRDSGKRPLFYIQVAPLQGNQFSLPKSRCQRQQEPVSYTHLVLV